MIRDTSAQDKVVSAPSTRKRTMVLIGIAVAAVVGIALLVPTVSRLLSSDAAASLSQLRIGEVKRGTLVRDAVA